MPEAGEGYIPSKTQIEPLKPQEALKNQHFDYTLVFGQGPVQEIDKVPKTGREGLNFYSRLEAKAAAEMLKQGVTDHLILSGGKTGARAETDEGRTEADLMMDLIRKEIKVNKEGNFINSKGKQVKFSEAVLIENLADDSLENFTEIINRFIDQQGFGNAKMALLGIGFHAHSTRYMGVGGGDIGRLEALSSIYKLDSPVYSAEEVLRELIADQSSAVKSIMGRLLDLSENSNVTMLKAQQEGVLVDMLKEGDWLRKLGSFKSEARIKKILLGQPETLKELGFSPEELQTVEIGLLRQKIQELFIKIDATHTLYPKETKPLVFKALESMGTIDDEGKIITEDDLKKGEWGRNMLTFYGKGKVQKKP
ncbi:MAG: hypothetical protein WCT22_00210 [Patescibacteria group bacterium]|jgi:hypothetical protein